MFPMVSLVVKFVVKDVSNGVVFPLEGFVFWSCITASGTSGRQGVRVEVFVATMVVSSDVRDVALVVVVGSSPACPWVYLGLFVAVNSKLRSRDPGGVQWLATGGLFGHLSRRQPCLVLLCSSSLESELRCLSQVVEFWRRSLYGKIATCEKIMCLNPYNLEYDSGSSCA
jgi:hypothetical protein